MTSLNSNAFFALWQSVYYAASPGPDRDRWQVDGVDWRRDRHLYWSDGYAFQVEAHRLECRERGKILWSLMVVVERWWGEDRSQTIREARWSRLTAGRADQVLRWFRKRAGE